MNSECCSPDLSSELEVHTSDFLVDSAQSQANTSSVRGPKLEVASVPWTQGLALFPVYFPFSHFFFSASFSWVGMWDSPHSLMAMSV